MMLRVDCFGRTHMIFGWLKRWRRRRILADPFPKKWLGYLRRNLPFYALLTRDEKARLRDLVRIFTAEKSWEGCNGLRMTDEIKVTIAAQACLLVLNLDQASFDGVQTILVYPAEFYPYDRRVGDDGIICEDGLGLLGEAWYRGPVILSWADVRIGARRARDGVNVVFHEFAHKLDMLDGVVDGTPPLENAEMYKRWREVMTAEFERLVELSSRNIATILDTYGANNPGEFFAVCTECFFERPVAFARRHRKLYELLKDYYGQDPVARMGAGSTGATGATRTARPAGKAGKKISRRGRRP
jgi:Mlc titration factor MtfA (ptsG expression regulator)